jgi:ribosomal protein S18 acetylase RimI-like enzyme
MAAYRFCRTDDIGLLVDALNRCWAPYYPAEPPATPATFKRSIRDLQVWCSSCMVAFAGSEPVGVLIGAKRPSGTLVYRIAVHPDHRRQGHARHLLASLGSKLAILGPPRIVAEVPETLAAARGLFSAGGYVQEAQLTDYLLPAEAGDAGACPAMPPGRFVIPVTVDDLAANGLLGEPSAAPAEAHPPVCWERSLETLTARKSEIAGLAIASDERLEACVLYVKRDAGPGADREAGPATAEILLLRSFVEDDGARLRHLLTRVGAAALRFPKVHPSEFPGECLPALGFRPAAGHALYAARALPD